MEHNKYKDKLLQARGVIEDHQSTVVGENGMGDDIKTKIVTHEGWVCDAADDLIEDLTGKCTPVVTELENAWSEVNSAYHAQPSEVPENDWRGNRYGQSYGGYHNIPV